MGWIQWFCGLEDHYFFCEVNDDFIKNDFNLYGLKNRVTKYKYLSKHSAKPSKWYSELLLPQRKKLTIPSTSQLTQISRHIPTRHWTLRPHSREIHHDPRRTGNHAWTLPQWQIRKLSTCHVRKTECSPHRYQLRFKNSQSQGLLSSLQRRLFTNQEISRRRWSLLRNLLPLSAVDGIRVFMIDIPRPATLLQAIVIRGKGIWV